MPDWVVFDKLIQVLVFGCASERIADHTRSDRRLRRGRDEWITVDHGRVWSASRGTPMTVWSA
jgi:hypothetical protein